MFETRGDLLIIRPEGERLDAAGAPAFKRALQEQVTGRPDRVILDASGLAFVDSSGLGTLVGLMKLMGEPGVLAIAGAQAPLRRLLQITQLDRVFRMFDTVDDAAAQLGA